MRRHAALIALLSLQALVAAFAVGFHLWARVAVREAFLEYATAMPAATAVALSPWLLPGALGVTGLLCAAAVALPLRRSRRAALVSAGLLVSSCTLVFAVWAAFAPIFRPE